MTLLAAFTRPDERQFVFLVQYATADIRVVEATELWEEPREGPAGTCYFHYPTVFGQERFATLDEALVAANEIYPWIGTAAKTADFDRRS